MNAPCKTFFIIKIIRPLKQGQLEIIARMIFTYVGIFLYDQDHYNGGPLTNKNK